jgi:hypothetical protein
LHFAHNHFVDQEADFLVHLEGVWQARRAPAIIQLFSPEPWLAVKPARSFSLFSTDL